MVESMSIRIFLHTSMQLRNGANLVKSFSVKSIITGHERSFGKYFKKGNLGHGSFVNYPMDVCNDLKITGLGDRDSMTRHGLRATVITVLFENGYDAVAVSLRPGHRQLGSALAYVNLRGELGKRQQMDILPNSEQFEKRQKQDHAVAIGLDKSTTSGNEVAPDLKTPPTKNENLEVSHKQLDSVRGFIAMEAKANGGAFSQPITVNINFNNHFHYGQKN